jgi:hypothetical protein
MSERGFTEPAWRIIRLRFQREEAVWHAVGAAGARMATIVLPGNVKGESAGQWLARIDHAFEQAWSEVASATAVQADPLI